MATDIKGKVWKITKLPPEDESKKYYLRSNGMGVGRNKPRHERKKKPTTKIKTNIDTDRIEIYTDEFYKLKVGVDY